MISPFGAEIQCRKFGLSIALHEPISPPSKPDIPPDRRWRIPMKKMILAALTVLSLGAGVANAQSFTHSNPSQTSTQYGLEGGGG